MAVLQHLFRLETFGLLPTLFAPLRYHDELHSYASSIQSPLPRSRVEVPVCHVSVLQSPLVTDWIYGYARFSSSRSILHRFPSLLLPDSSMTSDCRVVLSWLAAASAVVALLRVALVVLYGEMLHFQGELVAPVEALVLHA